MGDRNSTKDQRAERFSSTESEDKRPGSERVEAVAARLMEKRFLLDRPSRSTKLDLPEVSRTIADGLRPSSNPAPKAPDLASPSLSIEPSRISMSEGRPAGEPNQDPTHQAHEVASSNETISSINPSVPASAGPMTAGRPISDALTSALAPSPIGMPQQSIERIALSRSPLSSSTGAIEGRSESSSRIVNPNTQASTRATQVSGGQFDLAPTGNPRTSNRSGAWDGPSGQAGSSRIGGASGAEALDEPGRSTESSIDHGRSAGGPTATPGVRNLDKVSVPVSRVAPSGIMADSRSDSSSQADTSMSFVRNPRSSDLGNFSMAGSASPGQGGVSSSGGAGSELDDPSASGSSPSQGGGPVDLTKTNELLQQLLDAVRKQRGSSLPAGGQSVYSDR